MIKGSTESDVDTSSGSRSTSPLRYVDHPLKRTSSPSTSNSMYYEFEEIFQKLPLGLVMSYRKGSNCISVSGFVNIAASHHGKIIVGDELISVNGIYLEGKKSKAVLKIINQSSCPLKILFRRSLYGTISTVDIDRDLPSRIKTTAKTITTTTTTRKEDLKETSEWISVDIVQSNCRLVSELVQEINDLGIKMKETTGVGNESVKNINFSKISSFRDTSAGLGYRLDIAIEKLEKIERRYISSNHLL